MNQLMILVVALVIFVYFGGKYVPSVLRQNKQLLLGTAVGLVLCSFMGLRLEGWAGSGNPTGPSPYFLLGLLVFLFISMSLVIGGR